MDIKIEKDRFSIGRWRRDGVHTFANTHILDNKTGRPICGCKFHKDAKVIITQKIWNQESSWDAQCENCRYFGHVILRYDKHLQKYLKRVQKYIKVVSEFGYEIY